MRRQDYYSRGLSTLGVIGWYNIFRCVCEGDGKSADVESTLYPLSFDTPPLLFSEKADRFEWKENELTAVTQTTEKVLAVLAFWQQ